MPSSGNRRWSNLSRFQGAGSAADAADAAEGEAVPGFDALSTAKPAAVPCCHVGGTESWTTGSVHWMLPGGMWRCQSGSAGVSTTVPRAADHQSQAASGNASSSATLPTSPTAAGVFNTHSCRRRASLPGEKPATRLICCCAAAAVLPWPHVARSSAHAARVRRMRGPGAPLLDAERWHLPLTRERK